MRGSKAMCVMEVSKEFTSKLLTSWLLDVGVGF